MGSVKENILAACAVQEKEILVEGQTLFVREVSALEFAEYGVMNKTDRLKATGFLLSKCVSETSKGPPMLTVEEGMEIAKSARVSRFLMGAIMELSGFGEKEAVEKEPDAS